MSSSRTVKRLQKSIQRRNGELQTQALVDGVMGLAAIAGTFGLIFAGAWLLSLVTVASSAGAAVVIAALVTAVFLAVAMYSAWQRVNPMAELAPPPPDHPTVEWVEDVLGNVSDLPMIDPRYAVAGAAALLLSGPENLLEAIALWNHRLPSDETVVEHAAELLELSSTGATAEDISDTRAAVVLRRLSLIRITHGDTPHLETTDRGDRLLGR